MRTIILAAAMLAAWPAFVSGQAPPQRPMPAVSPEVQAGGSVTFRVRAASAKDVSLRGQWSREALKLTPDEGGVWSVTVDQVPPGVWEYSFVVDGLNVLDSLNPLFKPQREPSKSILHIPATPPSTWDWQDVPHGTVHQHAYQSKALSRQRELWVYTPPGYERAVAVASPAKYPLLVLQHGSGDNQATWVVHGKAHWILDSLIAAGRAKPMVVVMLDGHPLGSMSRETPTQRRGAALDAFRRELLEDAIPLVESLYQVRADAASRAIAGLSMGGGQSLGVGLAELDRFAWIGAFSAAVPSDENAQKLLADPSATTLKLKLLWIGCGRDDFLRSRNEEFVTLLKSKGVPHEWHLTDGNHSWPVWRQYLADFAPLLFQDQAK